MVYGLRRIGFKVKGLQGGAGGPWWQMRGLRSKLATDWGCTLALHVTNLIDCESRSRGSVSGAPDLSRGNISATC